MIRSYRLDSTQSIRLYDAAPPEASVQTQVLKMVEDNITNLSMLSVPASNLLFDIYRWALPEEVSAYLHRIGTVPGAPAELLVSFDKTDPGVVTGFLLYAPVPTDPEACGINYMAVKRSHRRRGIGRALMSSLVARYPHVELTCTIEKVPFYEALGFRVLDRHNTQVVMNTRSASSTGLMATLDVTALYESRTAKAMYSDLVQRWGLKKMLAAEKELARHVAKLERRAKTFVAYRLRAS